MAKKKQTARPRQKVKKNKKENLVYLEDCSKNKECGVSTVDDIKVIVFYNTTNYKVKIVIPKRQIVTNVIRAKNSKFDLYIKFEDTLYSNSGGNLCIELLGKYKMTDRRKKPSECETVSIGISKNRYHGTIVVEPELFIPEEWASNVSSYEEELAYKHHKNDIKRMGVNSSNYINYDKNNAYKPFQGGDCTGGK